MGFMRWATTFDKGVAFSPEVKGFASSAVSSMGKGIGKMARLAGKGALAVAAVGAAAYAATSIYSSVRGDREYKEPASPNPEPDLTRDPYAEMGLLPQQQETMMGMAPVEGKFAQQVLARRGGMAQGINTAVPDIEGDGRSSVDGRPVQDMGSVGFSR